MTLNYFVGSDKSKWCSNIPTYGTVTYKDVYKNIDIKFYGNNKNIEHDVIVRPGGDFSNVKFAYSGIKGLNVRDDGNLEVTLNHGTIIEERPVIYQEIKGERVAVEGAYKILKATDGTFTYGFTVASYDKTKDLVIDPVLVYSTYLGGTYDDFGRAIAVDDTGAVYVTGFTPSTDFPLMNPIQGATAGNYSAFVTKINPAGTAIVYSTYLGGTGDDYGYGIAVDASGSTYVTGTTGSTDFPLMNPIQGVKVGTAWMPSAFVTKIDSAGASIVYSTFLGGSLTDEGSGIAVDSSGAAYVSGYTNSTDFPVASPIQGVHGGSFWDAFVTKINPAGSAYVYSTYLGGSSYDEALGIAVDSFGAAYVTGWTDSADFPVMNPIQGTNGGGAWISDAFITKINPAGSAYVYSTYLGGSSYDEGHGIAVDSAGSAYVAGRTSSTDFPLATPIQATFAGIGDAFVTKINPAGSAYTYSTYLGGTGYEQADGIAVDSSGTAYVTGWTASTDFPLVAPIQGFMGGGVESVADAFVTEINPAGSAYSFSTYLGGSTSAESGSAIAVDTAGAIYVTGYTSSTDFPLMNPIQGVKAGGAFTNDAFITKIGASSPVVTLAITPDAVSIPQGFTLGYNVTATNTTAVQQCFNYWENVNLPGGTLFPPTDSLFKPVPRLCLNGGASMTVHLTHGVPLTAPIGAYVFNSYVGIYPYSFRVVVDTTSFNFNVTAGVAPIRNRQTSWRLIENSFRR